MTPNRPELLEATNETIVDAMGCADPMVLRGLLYQLTGDPELIDVRLGPGQRGRAVAAIAETSDVTMIRAKAAFLHR